MEQSSSNMQLAMHLNQLEATGKMNVAMHELFFCFQQVNASVE